MKVLCISANGKRLKVDVGSDQAILRQGEPVFVPEPVEEWRSSVAPAVRISRLGTAIKASSARAYYDSIAPVHLLTPADNSVADGLPPFVLDRALSPGKWTAPLNSDGTYTLTVSKGSIGSDASENFSHAFTHEGLGIDNAIAALSRHLTFRTGDIIVLLNHAIALGTPVLDTEIKAFLNDFNSLDIRIK